MFRTHPSIFVVDGLDLVGSPLVVHPACFGHFPEFIGSIIEILHFLCIAPGLVDPFLGDAHGDFLVIVVGDIHLLLVLPGSSIPVLEQDGFGIEFLGNGVEIMVLKRGTIPVSDQDGQFRFVGVDVLADVDPLVVFPALEEFFSNQGHEVVAVIGDGVHLVVHPVAIHALFQDLDRHEVEVVLIGRQA